MKTMKTLKIIIYGMAILFAISFVGSICYILFSNDSGTNAMIAELAGKALHLMKILFYVFLILLVLGIVGGGIYYLSTRPVNSGDDDNNGADTGPHPASKFLDMMGGAISTIFTSFVSMITWMAKEMKATFVILVIGLCLALALYNIPTLAGLWGGAYAPKDKKWSAKQALIANGLWPDGKKTVWFWQSSKSYPKLARTVDKEIGLIEAYDRHDQRRYELTNRLIDSGLYKMKTTTTTSTNESPSTSQTQKASIPNLDESLMTKRIKNSANAGVTASTGTSNTEWNMGSDKNPSIPDLKDNQMTKRFENASNQQ